MLKVLRVTGNSMNPALLPQDLILVSTMCKSFCPGEIVVFNSQKAGLVVKRISSNTAGVVRLKGDNPRLGSSICDQDLDTQRILGKVIGKWRTPFRDKMGKNKTLVET